MIFTRAGWPACTKPRSLGLSRASTITSSSSGTTSRMVSPGLTTQPGLALRRPLTMPSAGAVTTVRERCVRARARSSARLESWRSTVASSSEARRRKLPSASAILACASPMAAVAETSPWRATASSARALSAWRRFSSTSSWPISFSLSNCSEIFSSACMSARRSFSPAILACCSIWRLRACSRLATAAAITPRCSSARAS